jgi:hypothetical protein
VVEIGQCRHKRSSGGEYSGRLKDHCAHTGTGSICASPPRGKLGVRIQSIFYDYAAHTTQPSFSLPTSLEGTHFSLFGGNHKSAISAFRKRKTFRNKSEKAQRESDKEEAYRVQQSVLARRKNNSWQKVQQPLHSYPWNPLEFSLPHANSSTKQLLLCPADAECLHMCKH